jgi:tRNA threonylcarbamoyladenosine biosynthesis protein TsaE
VNNPFEFSSDSELATGRLGAALGRAISGGMVVALAGNLGAGKTRFVQAAAEALGADRREVTSPTFVLIQEYDARLPVYHFDAYRLRDVDEFLELGAEELFESGGVCFVEWADRVEESLPADRLLVEIEITAETGRLFRVTATGPQSRELLGRLQVELDDDA